jgi:hypothetical protein
VDIVTWKEARLIAIGHVRRLGLPRRLDGVVVPIAEHEGPGATLVHQALAREVRKRGGEIRFVNRKS